MRTIAIVGAGGFGREVRQLLEQINDAGSLWEIAGFFDDTRSPGTLVRGLPVLGPMDQAAEWATGGQALAVAIGDSQARCDLVARLKLDPTQLPTLVHPSVWLPRAEDVSLGAGTIVAVNAVISDGVSLGRHAIVNVGSQIGHDAQVGDFCSIMPHCNVSGWATLGARCFLGVKSVILDKVTVGAGSTVAAGSVVFTPVPEDVTVMGSPARVVFRKSPL